MSFSSSFNMSSPDSELYDFINGLDSEAIVLFDINDTLITYDKNHRIFRQINHLALVKLKSIIKQERNDFSKIFDFMFSDDNKKLVLTNNELPQIINTFKAKSTLCFAMTAIRTGRASKTSDVIVEKKWSDICKSFGIFFDNSYDFKFPGLEEGSPETKELQILKLEPFYKNNGAMICDGIIYCNNINKGHILEYFIQHIKSVAPEKYADVKKIVMFDDSINNLESMKNYTHNIAGDLEFVGHHYTKVIDDEANLDPIDDNYIRNYIDSLYQSYDNYIFNLSSD